jgi:hypothetical protein
VASDGKWYPPELHPDAQAASQAAAPAVQPAAEPDAGGQAGAAGQFAGGQFPADQTLGAPAEGTTPAESRTRLFVLIGLLVIAVAAGAAYLVHRSSSSTTPVTAAPPLVTPTTSGPSAAQDRTAQASLNSASTSASAIYQAAGRSFATLTPTTLSKATTPVTVVGPTVPSTSSSTVSMASTTQAVLLTNASASGSCWWILHVEVTAPGVAAGLPTAPGMYYNRSQGPSCQAGSFPTSGWRTTGFVGLG